MTTSGRVQRALVTAAIAAAAALLVGTPAASAQVIERSHDRGTFIIGPETLCGIDGVILTVEFLENFIERLGSNGFPMIQSTGRFAVTSTNPATGLSVVNKVSGGNFKDLSVTENGDGTITVRTATTGIPEQVILPDGTVAIKDVGRIVFVAVIDYNGTPIDGDDDVFISRSIESVSGPHPEADSNGTLFCPALIDALT